MFKHPWDSWNRMQFIVQARSPPATSRRPKAEGLRARAKRAAFDPKCIHLGVNTCRRRLRVFDPEYIGPKYIHQYERSTGFTWNPEKLRKIPEKVQKESRKSPEKVQRKIRIIPECVSEKSRENAEEVQKKFPENQFLKKSIIYSIHLKGKVNDYLMMRQYSCGILPTFLSLEAHQGKIISYVTAIRKPQWDFQITVTAKKCFAFHSLYNF